ncbi:MAG TPA: DNA repair protein RecO [Verrucomicrobiae bacterium]|nr:DNA repair protein RecO [Verrucomicrobiae bacterium]
MIESVHGIIFRTRRFTETSLIVWWLTPALGRLSTIAKGALRAKSPFRGKLDLFYEAEFSFARSRRSELHTLREINLRDTHAPLRRELGLLRQAAYAAGLVEQGTERETPLPGPYELMRGFLDALPGGAIQAEMVYSFELKFLHELGLQPDVQGSQLPAGTRRIAADLAANDWTAVRRLRSTPAQSAQLKWFLQDFIAFHLGKVPRGRNAALGAEDSRRL